MSTKQKDAIIDSGATRGQPGQFELIEYQLTTQTVVLEMRGIVFNDFRIDVDMFATGLRKLRERQGNLGGL